MGTDVQPLEQLDVALGSLRRVWDSPALRRSFAERLGRSLEPTLVRTLKAIAADTEPGVGDVATRLGVDISTASRLVDQAVAEGCVVRSTSAQDRRRSVLTLTNAGEALLERVVHVRTEILAELTEGWRPEDVTTLASLLGRLAGAINRIETSP